MELAADQLTSTNYFLIITDLFNSIEVYWPSFTFIYLHLPPIAFIYLHTPLYTSISLHLPSYTFIYLQKGPLTFIHLHLPQLAFIHLHYVKTALLRNQHLWMRWLDGHSNFARVLSFDVSKAFDSVSHRVVTDKLKKVPDINPYIVN